MRHDARGSVRSAGDRFPPDTVVHAETTHWRLHLSVEDGSLIVEPLDYHAGPLYLQVEDLERALAVLRAKKQAGA